MGPRVRGDDPEFGEANSQTFTRQKGVDRPVERFATLNGLDGNASIKARERVKIVVD